MSDTTHKLEPTLSPGEPANHVSLLFTFGEQLQALSLREGQSVTVGRSEPAQLVLHDSSLSRRHARLTARGGSILLEDLGSTNGCSVAGTRVSEATLHDGDTALLGTVEVRITGAAFSSRSELGPLTHAAFMRKLNDELARAQQFGRPMALLAIRHMPEPALRQLLVSKLRRVDALCGFAPSLTLLMLAEQDAQQAAVFWDQLRAQLPNAQAGLVCYPQLCGSPEALVSSVLDAVHAAQKGALHTSAVSNKSQDAVVRDAQMVRLYELVARAARTTLPVLVRGETGSGKELVARAVHDQSPRAKRPFRALNCATIPANLIESVLFGHERGAFTGADKQTQGVFEQALGGTVFLDEIGELAPPAQAALLRVLEARRLVRVGGSKEIEVDVRVVAATHRDLSAMTSAGAFREDLLFRLDALTLQVPPLRNRRDEILPLAELFLARAREQWAASATELSEDAAEALQAFHWPGNVRQLRNVIERAVAVCAGPTIELEDLPEQLWLDGRATVETIVPPPLPSATSNDGYKSLPDRVREFEVVLIREALEKAHWNQAQAARILGLPRRTLANKVHAYGLLE